MNRLSNFSQMVDGAKAVLELWLQLLICCYVDITGVLILQSDSIMSEKKQPPPPVIQWGELQYLAGLGQLLFYIQ